MEFTLEELQCLRKTMARLIAENEYTIEKQEQMFPDYVALYNSPSFQERLQRRELLAGLTAKIVDYEVEKRLQTKILMN